MIINNYFIGELTIMKKSNRNLSKVLQIKVTPELLEFTHTLPNTSETIRQFLTALMNDFKETNNNETD